MRRPGRAIGLAALLGGSGVIHLVRPRTYEWLVPPELGDARAWVHASGVAEIATAGLMAVPATRRAGGWAAVAVLVGVLPAHAQTLRAFRHQPGKLAVAAARIPFQLPMLAVALRVARGR